MDESLSLRELTRSSGLNSCTEQDPDSMTNLPWTVYDSSLCHISIIRAIFLSRFKLDVLIFHDSSRSTDFLFRLKFNRLQADCVNLPEISTILKRIIGLNQ